MGWWMKVWRPGQGGRGLGRGRGAAARGARGWAAGWPSSRRSRAVHASGPTLVWLLIAYGFIASVLPVWMLLCPRDYLSTFLKIATVVALAIGSPDPAAAAQDAGGDAVRRWRARARCSPASSSRSPSSPSPAARSAASTRWWRRAPRPR